MKKNIRWQPELAHTIIYWSLTLIILFFSLILSLENTGPYWKSNFVLGIFLVFLFLGLRRSFILKSNSVIIRYAAFWKDREISVGQIRSLTPTNTGVQMILQDEKAPSVFMMRKKEKANFKNQNLKKRIFTGKEKSETYGSSRLASHSICLSIHAY